MVALSLLSLLLAPAALAAPWGTDGFFGDCQDPQSALNIPATFDQLQASPNLVLMGFGIQNYTCNANSTFDSIGAIGKMFDISCLYGTAEFDQIQQDAFNVWNASPETDPLGAGITQTIQTQFNVTQAGEHYFVNLNGALSAVWDLRSDGKFTGNPGAVVYAHKINSVPSPDGPANVDWVELTRDSGDLANTIYRINTVAGVPPVNCSNPGDPISVKYATKYVLVG